MDTNLRKPKRVLILLLLSFVLGFMIGSALLGLYERILKRPIVSLYIHSGFGRDSVRFVLAYVSSNDVALCHNILFLKTDHKRIQTHEHAIWVAGARARNGDTLLVPFIYEYARDVSWDKTIRKAAIWELNSLGGTREIAVMNEIAARTNDPMAEVAIELLKKCPVGSNNPKGIK